MQAVEFLLSAARLHSVVWSRIYLSLSLYYIILLILGIRIDAIMPRACAHDVVGGAVENAL